MRKWPRLLSVSVVSVSNADPAGRVKRENGVSTSTSPSGPSTAMSPESNFSPSEDEGSDSNLSSITLSDDDDMSEDSDGPSSRGKKSPAPKKSSKISRAEKRKIDREIQNMPDHWTQEEREAEIERMKAEKEVVAKGERKLRKKLGRKLTQGEKNQVRLALVSSSVRDCVLIPSITQSSSTVGATWNPTLSPSSQCRWRRTLPSSSLCCLSRRRVCIG